MTKEEALNKFVSPMLCKAHTINIINCLYDDFEKEKKLLWEQAHATGFRDFARKFSIRSKEEE